MRESFDSSVQTLFNKMFDEAMALNLATHISNRVEHEFDSMLLEYSQNLPLEERIVIEESCKIPSVKAFLIDALKSQLSNSGFTNMISRLLSAFRSGEMISEIIRESTITGLKALLKNTATPLDNSPTEWKVVRFENNSIILGDICTIYLGPSGNFAGAGKFGKDWLAVCLPISHNCVLVGTKNKYEFNATSETINFWSASLSTQVIFCNKPQTTHIELVAKIATKEPLIDQSEIQRLVNDIWATKLTD
jgi:hypothetical protein